MTKIENQSETCEARFELERQPSGVNELSALAGSERCEACADAVGADCGEGPPVPIPNTAVKLAHAENTRLATDW